MGALEQGTYDHLPLFFSSLTTGKWEDGKQKDASYKREWSWHGKRAATLTMYLFIFQGSFHCPLSWGCPHCFWHWFSSSWVSRTHFPPVGTCKDEFNQGSGLHQKCPSVPVSTTFSMCRSKWTQTDANITETLMCLVFEIMFSCQEKSYGKGFPTVHKKVLKPHTTWILVEVDGSKLQSLVL